ncbi:MAG: zinc transporter ZupT [Victivallaceae bacterium]|nr:zinc transporter ZupT [Victivallaceae bacterium]MDD4180919.1 zinc transporter ZupT [Victivallaceae bacterium]
MIEGIEGNVVFGLILTTLAGLSTGIGSCLAFFSNRSDTRFLAVSLGFSSGVMIYISFVEMLATATVELGAIHGKMVGSLYATSAFFGGIVLTILIDRLIPSAVNPHEVKKVEEMDAPAHQHHQHHHPHNKRLLRSGMFLALAIGLHNFPEGIATFVAALKEPAMGISIAVAIAIHNIPEGITVSVPIYYATGSRKKAFFWSFASGLAEPVGALLAWLFIMPFLTETLLSVLFSAVAGIMVFISFDELLPLAKEYGEHHLSIYGLIAGMLVMALSLAFF